MPSSSWSAAPSGSRPDHGPSRTGGARSGTAGPCCRARSPAAPRRRRCRAGGCARARSARVSAMRRCSHASSADQAEPVRGGGAVQRLGDVAEVGQQPLAVDLAEHPGGEAAVATAVSKHRRHAAPGEEDRPVRAAVRRAVGQPRRRRCPTRRRPSPKNGVRAAARTSPRPVRLLHRPSSTSHSLRGAVAKTLPLPATTAGTPASASAPRDQPQVGAGPREHGDVAGATGAVAVVACPRAEQVATVAGEVAVTQRGAATSTPPAVRRAPRSPRISTAQRTGAPGAGQPRLTWWRGDRVHDDLPSPSAAPSSTASSALEQPGVAAPVARGCVAAAPSAAARGR